MTSEAFSLFFVTTVEQFLIPTWLAFIYKALQKPWLTILTCTSITKAISVFRCSILQHSLVVNCRKLIYIVKSDYKFRRALRGMLDADHVTLCVNPSPKLMRLVKEIVEVGLEWWSLLLNCAVNYCSFADIFEGTSRKGAFPWRWTRDEIWVMLWVRGQSFCMGPAVLLWTDSSNCSLDLLHQYLHEKVLRSFQNVDRDAPGRTNQSRSIFVKHAYPFAYPTYFRAYIIGNDRID